MGAVEMGVKRILQMSSRERGRDNSKTRRGNLPRTLNDENPVVVNILSGMVEMVKEIPLKGV